MHKAEESFPLKPSISSLRNQAAFDLVNKKGKKHSGRFFILLSMPPSASTSTDLIFLGLKVSKKIGSAVVRNKVRRRLKYLLRTYLKNSPPNKWLGWTFVLIPYRELGLVKYRALESEMIDRMDKVLSSH